MYDLHSHILPGVDDGARTMEDSMMMAKTAVKHGTKAIVATPHRKDITENFSVDYVNKLVEKFNALLSAQNIDLEILPGMENHLDLELPNDLKNGKALRLNGSRYALVELPFFVYPTYVEDVLFKIQLSGITPILAHPERIEPIKQEPGILLNLVQRGMLSQVTAGSIVGLFGRQVKRLTRWMLEKNLVHVIAADAHFADGPRSPNLASGHNSAASIVGKEKADRMVISTPRAILFNQPVEFDPPVESPSPRKWWWLRRT